MEDFRPWYGRAWDYAEPGAILLAKLFGVVAGVALGTLIVACAFSPVFVVLHFTLPEFALPVWSALVVLFVCVGTLRWFAQKVFK